MHYFKVSVYITYMYVCKYECACMRNVLRSDNEVLTTVRMTMFWVLAPCGLIGRYVSEKHTVSTFGAEGGDSMFFFFRNAGIYLRIYMASKPRTSSYFVMIFIYITLIKHTVMRITVLSNCDVYSKRRNTNLSVIYLTVA
jgi:hypothetical protein